jgi:hypothetical protein
LQAFLEPPSLLVLSQAFTGLISLLALLQAFVEPPSLLALLQAFPGPISLVVV